MDNISRSNYFKVKDADEFIVAALSIGLEYRIRDASFVVYPRDGDWPNHVDVVKEIQLHLSDGEVCILHTVGYEGLRYLNHAMVAFNSAGVVLHQSHESFYDELNRLGYKFTRAES
jgi:hypothetical protein